MLVQLTWLTALIDNRHYYAAAEATDEVALLLRRVVDDPHPSWCSQLYVWDRPCIERPGKPYWQEYPGHHLRVCTDPAAGWGALTYHSRRKQDAGSWDTLGPDTPDASELMFDTESELNYRRSSAVPLEVVREAVREFWQTSGERPMCVAWQDARWL